jgi:hypothetical protein
MIVYVESNFCLELAFQQEQEAQAEQILQLAEAGRVELVFPIFVAASVLGDLRPHNSAPDSHAFLSRNSKDFNAMKADFAALGCRYVPKFDDGLHFILSKT